MADVGGATGAARRRQRRLRQFLRHERLTVAMALAGSQHHTSRGQKTARAGGEALDALHGHVSEAPLPQGSRPAPLAEVAGWQTRVLQHVVEHLSVLALDVPVPQMVDQLPDIEQFFRVLSLDAEQVIEVPKIQPFDVPARTAVRVPQLAEQLVEVPTIIFCSSLQRTVEQHVDIPVPGGGVRPAGLQGFLPGQGSTAPTVVQIVDTHRGGLQGSRPGQGSPASSSFHSPAGSDDDADEPGEGFFSHFSPSKKSARVPASVSPSTLAAQLEVAPNSIEWVQLRERYADKTYYWNRRTNSTVWQAPAGVEVVWIGERNEEGGVWYL